MAGNESNGTCLLSEERCCLSSDLPSSDMISHSPVLDSKQHLSPPLPPISLCLSLSPNPFPTELPKLPSEDQVGSVILLIINPWLLPIAQRIKPSKGWSPSSSSVLPLTTPPSAPFFLAVPWVYPSTSSFCSSLSLNYPQHPVHGANSYTSFKISSGICPSKEPPPAASRWPVCPCAKFPGSSACFWDSISQTADFSAS